MPWRAAWPPRREITNPDMVSEWLTACLAKDGNGRGTPEGAPFRRSQALAEQREDLLAILVGNAEGLHAELLLHLKGLQPRRFLIHIRVDQRTNAA